MLRIVLCGVILLLTACKGLVDAEKECLLALDDAQVGMLCNQFKKTGDSDLKDADRSCWKERNHALTEVEAVVRAKTDFFDRVTIFANSSGPECKSFARMVEQNRLREACRAFQRNQQTRCAISSRLQND